MTFLGRIESFVPCLQEFHLGSNALTCLDAFSGCRALRGAVGAVAEMATHLDLVDPYLNIDRFASTAMSALRLSEEEIARRLHHRRSWLGGGGGGFSFGDEGDGSYGDGSSGGYESGGYSGRGHTGRGYSDSGSSCEGAPLGPGELVQGKQLFDYFVNQGFSHAQASGILGNMKTESSFRTNAYNPGEGAIGLCQWEGGRRTALERFATQLGKAVTDWTVQAGFVMHELTHGESGAYESLKQCETPAEAARVFQSQYERSAGLTNRAANAVEIYHQLHSQQV
ncbi:MAG: hypothetical protein K2X81_07710 [Candidatus Obscuribacterales bacterium]|nr:hypothetical protein [Candidatus Obscuribacterales bacterium]